VLASLGRYIGLLRERDFRRLFLAHTISEIGSEVTLLAVPIVAIVVLDATPFEVAILGAVQFAAFTLFALPAGAIVDRLPRRRILVVGDLGRALVLLVIPAAAGLHVLSIGLLAVVAFAAAVLTVFFEIGDQSILPGLVERDRLTEANSRLSIATSAAQVLGPGIGGWLIGLLSAPVAIVVDALTFLGSAAFLVGIRGRALERPREPTLRRPSIRDEVAEGLRFYRRTPLLLAGSAGIVTSTFGIWLAGSTVLVYLVRELGLTAETIGLAFSLGAIGLVVGAAGGAEFRRRVGIGPALVIGCGLAPVAWALLAFADTSTAFAVLVLSGVLQGLASMVSTISYVSFRQAITPDALLGRVNATGRWLNWTLIPAGALIGGALATVIGFRATILIGTGISFLSVPILLLTPLGRLRELPELSPSVAPSSEPAAR
jgi:MFS family permease